MLVRRRSVFATSDLIFFFPIAAAAGTGLGGFFLLDLAPAAAAAAAGPPLCCSWRVRKRRGEPVDPALLGLPLAAHIFLTRMSSRGSLRWALRLSTRCTTCSHTRASMLESRIRPDSGEKSKTLGAIFGVTSRWWLRQLFCE